MPMVPLPRMTWRGLGALAVTCALVSGIGAAGCTFGYDVGDSSRTHLCDVLKTEIGGRSGSTSFSLVDLIDEIAADPSIRPPAAMGIAVSYRAKEGAYDRLGPYRPVIEYVARAGARPADDPAGIAAPSTRVRHSARLADQVLADGTCSQT